MTYLDMILRLQGSSCYQRVANANQINSHQPLVIQIGTEQTQQEIVSHVMRHGLLQYFGDLLIMLDYSVYVPFGKRGIKELEKHLNGESSKEYRIKKVCKVLNDIGIPVGETFKKRIDSLFNYLYSSKQNFEVIESVAATMRIIAGVVDNLQSKGTIIGINERDDKLEEISNKIIEHIKKTGNKEFDINDFLPQIDEDEPLNNEEKKYFYEIVNI